MSVRPLAIVIVMSFCVGGSVAQKDSTAAAIHTYLQPYAQSGNFAGDVLVVKSGKVIFEKAYGFADREHHIRNTAATRFHIASMSMQFTAAAVLRLVDTSSIKLDDRVGGFVPGIQGADKITIRDLLTQRSGLPDINALANYDNVLQHHQTPSSLIAEIEGRPLLFEPGSKFLHEEHSAYNLLALIVEKKSGLPFAAAVDRWLFQPANLVASGVDDDSKTHATRVAKGYEPEGTYRLKPARAIHWSAKTGNASVCTSLIDLTGKKSRLNAVHRKNLLHSFTIAFKERCPAPNDRVFLTVGRLLFPNERRVLFVWFCQPLGKVPHLVLWDGCCVRLSLIEIF